MTLEEKAKAYDEAIEKARQLCAYPTTKPFISDLKDIFPKLKESEDERIRSALLRGFNSMYANQAIPTFAGEPIKDILAWLEKQGMPAKYHDICDTCVRQPTCQSDCFLQQDEQKSAWSEEDKARFKSCIKTLQTSDGYDTINAKWLKSLRSKSQWKPSEEQMDALHYVTNFDYGGHKATLVSLYEQLKKLREK